MLNKNNDVDMMMKLLQESQLEVKLNKVVKDIEVEMLTNEIYMEYIDMKYEDKLRDLELVEEVRRKMTNLLKLSNRVQDIELEALKINSQDLFWKCESRKASIISQMELLRSKYDL